jgi:mono/diheme cytochrome c family protein
MRMPRTGGKFLKYIIPAAVIVGVGVWALQPKTPTDSTSERTANVKVPALSVQAADGKEAFDANCAACHGRNAAGTKNGPPLVHDIYNPGHHSDDAFLFAVMRGVSQHHWPYGDMPPQPQVTAQQIAAIVRYVRELQIANGIRYRPHRM